MLAETPGRLHSQCSEARAAVAFTLTTAEGQARGTEWGGEERPRPRGVISMSRTRNPHGLLLHPPEVRRAPPPSGRQCAPRGPLTPPPPPHLQVTFPRDAAGWGGRLPGSRRGPQSRQRTPWKRTA